MESQEVEVWNRDTNAVVLRLPWRRFPGMLLQGDTLATLAEQARLLRDRVRDGRLDEARDEADDLTRRLDDLVRHYAAVLDDAGVPLRFHRPHA
ncbi:DUF6959 family protein [Micromonospora sp. LZ34]